jgi:hypothetical protein
MDLDSIGDAAATTGLSDSQCLNFADHAIADDAGQAVWPGGFRIAETRSQGPVAEPHTVGRWRMPQNVVARSSMSQRSRCPVFVTDGQVF